MQSQQTLTPFPVLFDLDEPAQAWQWPRAPFSWRHVPVPDDNLAQPCRIETPSGMTSDGFMVSMKPAVGSLTIRRTFEGADLLLPLSSLRRLTLTTPLRSINESAHLVAERVPSVSQERDYRLQWARGGEAASGRTCGHVETPYGVFLFPPEHDGYSLRRTFVPRAAYSRCEFGLSAREIAVKNWTSTPRELIEAIERQHRMPVLPIGQALVKLGLATHEQIDHAMSQPMGDTPLGERLVKRGIITNVDLQTAIAHKMGYPVVDLTRFPIDFAVARKVALRVVVANRALPIMLDDDRLVVAVDRPSRMQRLQEIRALAEKKIVPVLASKSHLLQVLSALVSQDVWHERVSIQPTFFPTTL